MFHTRLLLIDGMTDDRAGRRRAAGRPRREVGFPFVLQRSDWIVLCVQEILLHCIEMHI